MHSRCLLACLLAPSYGKSVVVGLRFRVEKECTINSIRYYKVSSSSWGLTAINRQEAGRLLADRAVAS